MDSYFMRKAIDLAIKGRGSVSPNPLVGAVVVKNEKIIGQGYHQRYGQKHAEVNAIANCSQSPNGGTLYCNLEPCSTFYPGKKNPPCTVAIVEAGIKRVVIAQEDPNPRVSGSGVKYLKEQGLIVDIGVLKSEAQYLNRGYNSIQTYNRPYVHLKWAQTLDGKIATKNGQSKWISSIECRKNTHSLRSQYNGILVGRNTCETDNPTLDARYGFSPSPRPIVLDPLLKLNNSFNIFKRSPIIFCSIDSTDKRDNRATYVDLVGSKFEVSSILKNLVKRGINSLFVEGGSSVIGQFIKSGEWDEVTIYIAPKLLGSGIEPVSGLNFETPANSIKLTKTTFKTIDNHIVFNGFKG